MKATLPNLKRRVAEFGAQLLDGNGEFELLAPDGTRWCASDSHSLVAEYDDGAGGVDRERKAAAVARLFEDLDYGLEDCPTDCDCREMANEKTMRAGDVVTNDRGEA